MNERDSGLYANGNGKLADLVDGASRGIMRTAGVEGTRRHRRTGHMDAASRSGALGVGVRETVLVRLAGATPGKPPTRRR